MGKFKVNSKTGILFCLVLLETVSGLPFEEIDDVDGETVSDDAVDFLKDKSDLILTRIRREIHDSENDKFEDETSDEAGVAIDSRFGFYGGRFQGGAESWNNGHRIEWDGKFGHDHHHEFGYNPGHNHHHGFGPTHYAGYVPVHDQGHHNGFANHPWMQPGYNYKTPSGFDGSGPIANGPWNGGFLDKVDKTTTQKPTTLPQIDVRVGNH